MSMFDCPHCGDTHHVNDFCATGPMSRQAAPSNANTSGLEVVAWRYINCSGGWTIHDRPIPGIPTADPLVTAASAQARISGLQREVAVAVAAADHMADHATAAEARADRLASALSDLVSWFGKPENGEYRTVWVIPAGPAGGAVTEALAALQQETQP